MADSTIKVNSSKPQDLEFEITIQGITDEPSVKMVIDSKTNEIEYGFKCKHVEKDTWTVRLPALNFIKESSVPFKLEVVIDGYYFEPSQGTLMLVSDPEVKIGKKDSKPAVSVKSKIKTIEEMEVVGPQYSATNALLDPEMPPKEGKVKNTRAFQDPFTDESRLFPDTEHQNDDTEQEERDGHHDYETDRSRLSDISPNITPSAFDLEPQDDPDRDEEYNRDDDGHDWETLHTKNPEEVADSEFGHDRTYDSRKVAESIMREVAGRKVKAPEKKGSLLDRDPSGKVRVKGIDSPELKQARQRNAALVKDILQGQN